MRVPGRAFFTVSRSWTTPGRLVLWLILGGLAAATIFIVWPRWPVVVLCSDLAQLVFAGLSGDYIGSSERALTSALAGLALVSLLALAEARSSRLALAVGIVIVAAVVSYPEIRATALELSLNSPGRVEVELGHPRLSERIRLAITDADYVEPGSGNSSQLAADSALYCRMAKGPMNALSVAESSGLFSLPMFLEPESLGHDWVTIAYSDGRHRVMAGGFRSGGLHSEHFDSVLDDILANATMIDERQHCHELWDFAVRPLGMTPD
jgi:hypothetical protein